jgi:hypothetical protein
VLAEALCGVWWPLLVYHWMGPMWNISLRGSTGELMPGFCRFVPAGQFAGAAPRQMHTIVLYSSVYLACGLRRLPGVRLCMCVCAYTTLRPIRALCTQHACFMACLARCLVYSVVRCTACCDLQIEVEWQWYCCCIGGQQPLV